MMKRFNVFFRLYGVTGSFCKTICGSSCEDVLDTFAIMQKDKQPILCSKIDDSIIACVNAHLSPVVLVDKVTSDDEGGQSAE